MISLRPQLQKLYEGVDPFNAEEPDPAKTNALYSSCWELQVSVQDGGPRLQEWDSGAHP